MGVRAGNFNPEVMLAPKSDADRHIMSFRYRLPEGMFHLCHHIADLISFLARKVVVKKLILEMNHTMIHAGQNLTSPERSKKHVKTVDSKPPVGTEVLN